MEGGGFYGGGGVVGVGGRAGGEGDLFSIVVRDGLLLREKFLMLVVGLEGAERGQRIWTRLFKGARGGEDPGIAGAVEEGD